MTVGAVVSRPQYPLLALLFALAFLIVQDRIDRRDPKLTVSSVRQRDDEVSFPTNSVVRCELCCPARRSGIEVAPLSQRTAAMAFFRLAAVVVLGVLGGLQTDLTAGDAWVVGGYVISTGLLSAVVWTRFTTLAVKAFGVSLLLDGVFVQYAHDRLGHGLATDTVVAAFLVAVCSVGVLSHRPEAGRLAVPDARDRLAR